MNRDIAYGSGSVRTTSGCFTSRRISEDCIGPDCSTTFRTTSGCFTPYCASQPELIYVVELRVVAIQSVLFRVEASQPKSVHMVASGCSNTIGNVYYFLTSSKVPEKGSLRGQVLGLGPECFLVTWCWKLLARAH